MAVIGYSKHWLWLFVVVNLNYEQNQYLGAGIRRLPLLLRVLWFSVREVLLLCLPLPPNHHLLHRWNWIRGHHSPQLEGGLEVGSLSQTTSHGLAQIHPSIHLTASLFLFSKYICGIQLPTFDCKSLLS